MDMSPGWVQYKTAQCTAPKEGLVLLASHHRMRHSAEIYEGFHQYANRWMVYNGKAILSAGMIWGYPPNFVKPQYGKGREGRDV